jgi:predicted Zn-dependent protease
MNELQGDEAYEQLQKLLKEKHDNFRVMERQVNIDVQMAYFDAAKKLRNTSLKLMLSWRMWENYTMTMWMLRKRKHC